MYLYHYWSIAVTFIYLFWKKKLYIFFIMDAFNIYLQWGEKIFDPLLILYRPFDAVQLSCPLSRKTPPKHNVSTSMFDGGDGVLGVIGSILPPPNTASWVDAKELDFGLIWPQHFHPVLLWIIIKLQTGLYMCFLEQGDLAGPAGFQSFTA